MIPDSKVGSQLEPKEIGALARKTQIVGRHAVAITDSKESQEWWHTSITPVPLRLQKKDAGNLRPT